MPRPGRISIEADPATLRSEDAIRKSEAYHRLILEHSQDMTVVLRPDGTVAFYTPAVVATLGRAPEEFEGRPVFDFIHPDDLPAAFALFGKALASPGEPLTLEFRMLHRDGSWLTIEAVGKGLVDHPTIGGVLVSGRDVTRRVTAEASLRESEKRFWQLVSSIQEVFFLVDEDLRTMLFVSPSYEKVWGRSCQSLYERPASWMDAIHPDDLLHVRANLGADGASIEYRIVLENGEIRWIRARTFHVRDESGEVHRVAGVAEDVTTLHEANAQRLLQSAALTAAANAIVVTDVEGRISWVNPAFTRLTGYASEEVIGQSPRLLRSGAQDPAFYEQLWRTILAGQSWHGELINRRKDGTEYTEEQIITPVREGGRIGHFIAIKQDVTERKESERRLLEAFEKAKESDRLKSAFLANMSHEVRTPLNVIQGYGQLIAEHGRAANDVDLSGFVEKIEQAGRRLTTTIQSIVDISKLETGTFTGDAAPLALASVARDVLERFRPAGEEKGIDLVCDVSDPDAKILFDRYCLEHALVHLIDNAIKFTPTGTVTVRVRRGADGTLLLDVEDTGIGMDSQYLARIFEVFSQADSGHTRKFDGNGLGLALAKRYVEFGGASIEVCSERGRGSRFTVRLPRSLEIVAVAQPAASEPARDMSSRTAFEHVGRDVALDHRCA